MTGGDNQEIEANSGAAQAPDVATQAQTLSDEGGKESQADILVHLARQRADFFHDGEDAYAQIHADDHLETVGLASHRFRPWLARTFFESKGKAPSNQSLA